MSAGPKIAALRVPWPFGSCIGALDASRKSEIFARWWWKWWWWWWWWWWCSGHARDRGLASAYVHWACAVAARGQSKRAGKVSVALHAREAPVV